ncbi:MAG: hypothetical protein JXB48_16640 [Candidatus Latescibacteria bacterium]|nr:hypothetical protein [Candidatus Latescibacterota bacterium]
MIFSFKINKSIFIVGILFFFMDFFSSGDTNASAIYKNGTLTGKMIDCGFYAGDSNYHALVHASDSNVYYAICSHEHNTHVHLFCFNPQTEQVTTIADIGEVLGEDGTLNIPQGKIHCDLFECDGKLYFGTHVGIYHRGGSDDHGPYPGGHFMCYDLKSGVFRDYGIGAAEEGIVCLQMDTERKRLYTLTWPSALFMYYDITTGTKKTFGPAVFGHAYINETEFGGVPRSIGIDPETGNVYWWNIDETVSRYNFSADSIEILENHNFGRPILKVHERGSDDDKVFWRSIRWNQANNLFYGLTFYGEQLFSYDPTDGIIEVIDRIAPGPNRKSGELSRASLAFELSGDFSTIYYVNHLRTYTGDTEGRETDELRLVTYNIQQRSYTDHGPIVLDDGRKPKDCQGMEIGRDGNIYLVCTIPYTDMESDKGKAIRALRYKATPTEQLNQVYEVNLVIVKNPLMR